MCARRRRWRRRPRHRLFPAESRPATKKRGRSTAAAYVPALFALLPVALLVGGYWYVTGGKVMSTDDAYVDAEKVGISTDVPGIVQDVDVSDNEHVKAGQLLYRLDPRQFQIALNNAKANLAQTALAIDAMKQDYKRMLSDVAAEQSQVGLDQTNYNRDVMLLRSATVSQAMYDQTRPRSKRIRASSNRCASRHKRSSPSSTATPISPVEQHPQYQEAQAEGRRGATRARPYRRHGAVRRH